MINKNILITGGAGFIGSNLAIKLVALGYQVTVLDNLRKQIHGDDPITTSPLYRSILDKVHFIHGDVTRKEDLEKAIQGQDIIVHLAAETGTGQSMYQIEHYCNANIGGTAMLLDILANSAHCVKKVIVASSRAVYGEGKYSSKESGTVYPGNRTEEDMLNGLFEVSYPGCTEPLTLMATDEKSMIHPSSIYGITKMGQEQLVMTVTKSIGIEGVAFRYQNVYGPGQSLTNPYTGILSIFSTRILNGSPINVFEDGLESRDFVFIDDVVDATILGIESEKAGGNVYNVGTGIPINILTVVEKLMNYYNKRVPVDISGNFRIGDIRHNFADITKIKEELGYVPKVLFENGIELFAQWAEAQSSDVDNYEQSLDEMRQKGLLK